MIEYKGGKCAICGYSRSFRALCFHHTEGQGKRFTIAGGHNRGWESLRAELDRCVLLCHNCHHEVHDGMAVVPQSALAAHVNKRYVK